MLRIQIYWFLILIRIQHFSWITIRILFQALFDQNFKWYLIPGLPKERPSYWRSLQPSKENIMHFKTWNFLTYFLGGSFLPSWIRIVRILPGSATLDFRRQNINFCIRGRTEARMREPAGSAGGQWLGSGYPQDCQVLNQTKLGWLSDVRSH